MNATLRRSGARRPEFLQIANRRVLSAVRGFVFGLVAYAPALAAQRYGGTAVVGLNFDPPTMNALATSDVGAQSIQRDVLFAPLLKYDARLQPMPWAAERWDTLRLGRDSLQLTFRLRRDLRWHDGRPTTAEDVRWTFERAVDPRTAYVGASAFALYNPRAEVLGPYAVRFRLRRHADFLDGWRAMPPLPKHLLGNVAPEQFANHPFGTTAPVGNGPFRFARRAPGQEWAFAANAAFPRALGGRPYLDRLVFRPIPEATTRTTELVTGGIDLSVPVRAADAERLRATPGLRIVARPVATWNFVAWNTRLPFFDTPEERRALTLALDRRRITEAVSQGYGVSGRSLVTPLHWAYAGTDRRTALPYDPAAARRTLAAAGWRDRDGDGVLEDAAGRPFRFTLKVPQGNAALRDIAEVVQAQLRGVGVAMELQLLEPTTLIRQFEGNAEGGGPRRRDFEAVLLVWSDDLRKDDSQLFHSRHAQGARFWTGYSHPRLDQLLDTLPTIANRTAARPLWAEYQRHLAQAAPVTVLYYPRQLIGVRERLRGVEVDARGEFASAQRWWIQPQPRADARSLAGPLRGR